MPLKDANKKVMGPTPVLITAAPLKIAIINPELHLDEKDVIAMERKSVNVSKCKTTKGSSHKKALGSATNPAEYAAVDDNYYR